MGLDISFDRDKAVVAGLVMEKDQNSHNYSEDDDHGYIEWCKSEVEIINIPGTERWVVNNGVNTIVVRANRWGNTYKPLTGWLKSNGIEWEEW